MAFAEGIERLGFEVMHRMPVAPGPSDVFVTWNRIGDSDRVARLFEQAGRPVLVAENAAWGNAFAGQQWYTLALGHHNLSGRFPIGGSERWDALGVTLAPWRISGETVILPQRGIGARPVAMPYGWGSDLDGRVRRHPGRNKAVPLEEDLAAAGRVITWGSGAAIKALIMGIPVESHLPNWIGEQDNTYSGRLAMFRRLAWAQWTIDEIRAGVPFRRLLEWTEAR